MALPHEEKQDPSTSVKEEGDFICAFSLSLLLPVSSPHFSDSAAAYLKLIKGALYRSTPPLHSSLPHPQLNLSEAREISLSANSRSPVQRGLELRSPEGEGDR